MKTRVLLCCPVCDTEPESQGPRHFLRCPVCGLLYAREMQAADQGWYQRSWIYSGSRVPKALSTAEIEMNWAWGTFLRDAPLPRGTLLDVGCGRGDFVYAAGERGYQARGVDFQAELAHVGRELYGIDVLHGDIWRTLADTSAFDMVTAFEIVEHVADPVGLLRALAGAGRFVAVSVPCAERQPRLFARGFDDPPHHLTMWTQAALTHAMERAGLDVIFMCGDAYEPSHFGTYVSCLFGANYPGSRQARGAARRLGRALGRFVRPKAEGAFTLLALARSSVARNGRAAAVDEEVAS